MHRAMFFDLPKHIAPNTYLNRQGIHSVANDFYCNAKTETKNIRKFQCCFSDLDKRFEVKEGIVST